MHGSWLRARRPARGLWVAATAFLLACAAACGGAGGTSLTQDDGSAPEAGGDSTAAEAATPDAGSDATADATAPVDASGDARADAPADARIDARADADAAEGSTAVDAQAEAGADAAGPCGGGCTGGQLCVSGTCQCPIYQSFCNGACIPTSGDPSNCGGCNIVCPPAQACSAGACSASCLPPLVKCGQSCVDTTTNNQNCGGCAMPCPAGQGCASSQCVPTVSVGGTGPGNCVGGGPPIEFGADGGATCSGNAAQTTFTWALCSCGDVSMNGSLLTDAYNSAQGPYMPGGLGGGVGLNGNFSATSRDDIWGTLWSAADGGLSTGSNTDVKQDLHVAGTTTTTASIGVGGDGYCGGNVDGTAGAVSFGGTLHLETGMSTLGSVTYGSLVQQPLTVPPPCACGSQLLPVAAWVAAARPPNNDNATIGLDPNALAAPLHNPVRLDLPCGSYYLTSIDNGGDPVTIVAHGHTALFVDGNVTAGPITFTLDPTATFDIALTGVLTPWSGADVNLGSPNYPALCRLYEGGSMPTRLTGGNLAGDLYGGSSAVQASSKLTFYGSLFAGSFYNSSETYIHYDRANLQAGATCPPPGGSGTPDAGADGGAGGNDAGIPPTTCGTCKDCGNQACINGTCGMCTSSAQCCPPLTCQKNGVCALL